MELAREGVHIHSTSSVNGRNNKKMQVPLNIRNAVHNFRHAKTSKEKIVFRTNLCNLSPNWPEQGRACDPSFMDYMIELAQPESIKDFSKNSFVSHNHSSTIIELSFFSKIFRTLHYGKSLSVTFLLSSTSSLFLTREE